MDVIVGKFGLNRYGQICKPAPDQMFVAAAKMGLEPCEVVCISDCARDEVAAKGAGIGCMTIGSFSTEDLIDRVAAIPHRSRIPVTTTRSAFLSWASSGA